ncbi:unnamed protein product [Aphanomyces euteiches]|uniref:Uncharacterized protein n=1 Tax=Aphanomyces euteiches TaxID=100861 RepID=A0A6G0XUQ3_9STRA|nr:hypothetical protein Ae201684_001323 [Aphanomyces euteiches]KAH9139624.1 hypothetical protein AeRB84_016101 [Aphanomyces euteiches]
MHTNWHSDESDGSSWMDEQGSEGRQSSVTSSFLRPKTPGDALAEAVQRIQLDLDLWQESYDGEITTGLEEAWAAIARQVDEVSKQVAAKAILPPPKPEPSLLTIPIMSQMSRRRNNSINSEAQAESDWAGLWYLLGNTDDDRNRRLGVNRGSSMPGDAYVLNQIWSCLDSRDFAAVAAVCTDWFRLVYHSKMGQRQWQHIASNRWRHIQDWDKNELVQLLCGSTHDWRKRFIALHSLSNNWITGKQTASVTSIQPPVLKCFQVVKPNQMLVAGDSRGWIRYLNVSGSDSSSQPAYQAHRYSIDAIATPQEDSNRVLTGSIDGSLSVHDILTGQLVGQLRPSHLDAISSLEMLDNERGLSASHDATVRLWDFRMGYPASVVFEDQARLVSVLGATASPDKTNLLAFYEDGACSVWDMRRAATPVQVFHSAGQYASSTWLSSSTCLAFESNGSYTVYKNLEPTQRFSRYFKSTPLGSFSIPIDSAAISFGVFTGDPSHAIEVYRSPDRLTSRPQCSYTLLSRAPLRCCAIDDSTALYGVDVLGQLCRWDFARG